MFDLKQGFRMGRLFKKGEPKKISQEMIIIVALLLFVALVKIAVYHGLFPK